MIAADLVRQLRGKLLAIVGLAFASVALLSAPSALASSGSWWHVTSGAAPTNLPVGGEGHIFDAVSNLGYADVKASVEHPVVLTDRVPSGLEVVAGGERAYAGPGGRGSFATHVECEQAGQLVTCKVAKTVPAYEGFELVIPVKVVAEAGARPVNEVTVTGGEGATPGEGAPAQVSAHEPLQVGGTTGFGVEKFEFKPEDETGGEETQAGAHPFQLTTTLNLNDTLELNNSSKQLEEATPALVHDLHFLLPAGLLGNITVVPQCTSADFSTITPADTNLCASSTALGVARIKLNEPVIYHGALTESVPVFNLVPAAGEPARFGIEVDKVPVILNTAVRTASDYAVEVSADDTTESAALLGTQVTFWGIPGDQRHNHSRGWECLGDGHWVANAEPPKPCPEPKEANPKPFLSLQTSCSSTPETTVTGDSWPQGAEHQVFTTQGSTRFATRTGCSLLEFAPAIAVEPDSHAASTPTGLSVNITVPQTGTLTAGGKAASDVKDTTLVLPEGLQASPGAANGLLSCSAGSVGFNGSEHGLSEGAQLENDHFDEAEAGCPEASKIGTVTIRTPLLEHALTGGVYLASQDTDPFQSPLVLYLIAYDPASGVRVKLAGEVQVNQSTGQLTSVFKETPAVPFEELSLHLFGGSRASQSNPALCGDKEAAAAFTPYSGGAVVQTDGKFSISEGAEGTPCQYSFPQSFAPATAAGSTNPQAGAFTDFSLTITHPDADQPLSGVSVHLPEGIAAMLANVTPCPEPPAGQEWSCGAESLVGESRTSSGLGGSPFTLGGSVYLTAGYDGAPFGLLVSTLAKAGPFNLGVVNVRSRIEVDPNTAAVTITTDPGPHGDVLPTMLKGVPVQLKQLNVTVNRPSFQFNPTTCAPLRVTGTLDGSQGGTAAVSYPFNAANCATLPFAPRLTATAGGQASKPDGASLNVKVESSGLGQANIAKVDLTLPIQLPSRLTTIQKACLAAVFSANPAACDEGSLIGKATIVTPVLKNPLMGPAYLVSHGGAAFPDVEFVLQGEGITLILDGKTDIKNGITYSRFESTPDAPFTSFVTELPTGPHSALTAYVPASQNYSLCATNLAMPTEITAQNGAVIRQTTKIVPTGCKGVAAYKISRAQRLAKALKACRKLKKKGRRVACERVARRRYGAIKKAPRKRSPKKK